MQTKTKWWIIAGITIALANVAFCCYRYFTRSQRVEAAVEELDETQSTHGAMVFFEPEVDMMMVGKWQHTAPTHSGSAFILLNPQRTTSAGVESGTRQKIYTRRTSRPTVMAGLSGKRRTTR